MDKRNRKKKTVDDTVCEIHNFSGYAVLSNCFVRSANLSWSAIGLLARVMDFPGISLRLDLLQYVLTEKLPSTQLFQN